jgi:hypothetical protein
MKQSLGPKLHVCRFILIPFLLNIVINYSTQHFTEMCTIDFCSLVQMSCYLLMNFARHWIVKGLYYIEYNSLCPVVWIGYLPPTRILGGDTCTRLRGRRWRGPIQTNGHKLWYSLYSSYPLTLYWSNKRSEIAEKYEGFCPFKKFRQKSAAYDRVKYLRCFLPSTFIFFLYFACFPLLDSQRWKLIKILPLFAPG